MKDTPLASISHTLRALPDDQPLLDDSLLDTLDAILGEELQEVVALFCGKLPGMVDTLLLSLRSGDHESIRHQAHSLKGSAGSMGALALTDLARRIEWQARQHQAIPAADAPSLAALAAATRSALAERYLAQPLPAGGGPARPSSLDTE